MRGRDGQARPTSSAISRENADRWRGCATDSSRPVAVRGPRGPRARRPRTQNTAGVNATATEPGVRQSSGALAAWYRWQHGSDDRATDSTAATDYCAYRLALEQQQQQQQQQARTRGGVAAILRVMRPASAEKLEAPGNGRANGPGEIARWRGSRIGMV